LKGFFIVTRIFKVVKARAPKCLLVLTLLFSVLFSQLVVADDLVISPYSHSSLSSSDQLTSDDYLVLMSAPKRVNNQLRVEKELRASVTGLTETYRINDGHTTEQAFKHYLSQVKQLSAKVVYQCASRDCGRSSGWAEDVYRNSKLYGNDASQFYFAAALQRNGEQWLVTVYTVERGNRRVYAHVETLKLNAPIEGDSLVGVFDDPQSLYVFNYDFNNTVKLNVDSAEIQKIMDLVETMPAPTIYIVGHMFQSGESTAEALKLSLNAAEQLSTVLQKRGVDASKISTLGVGPLIPVNQGIRTGNRVEVMVLSK
jgi:outer membrane protein OmpA-like peptidoglycan-associated protein